MDISLVFLPKTQSYDFTKKLDWSVAMTVLLLPEIQAIKQAANEVKLHHAEK